MLQLAHKQYYLKGSKGRKLDKVHMKFKQLIFVIQNVYPNKNLDSLKESQPLVISRFDKQRQPRGCTSSPCVWVEEKYSRHKERSKTGNNSIMFQDTKLA